MAGVCFLGLAARRTLSKAPSVPCGVEGGFRDAVVSPSTGAGDAGLSPLSPSATGVGDASLSPLSPLAPVVGDLGLSPSVTGVGDAGLSPSATGFGDAGVSSAADVGDDMFPNCRGIRLIFSRILPSDAL